MAAAPAAAVLASAGKDSTLAALLLDPFYDVTLCHCTFGIDPSDSADAGPDETTDPVYRVAAALGVPLRTVELDESVAREAVDQMHADGFPRNGIQTVHEHALETVAGLDGEAGFDAVADGTRRDDRAPDVGRPFAQSLEDRHGVDYVQPLAGYGRGAVDDLAERALEIESGPSEEIATGDYEMELRALLADEHGPEAVAEVFPEHTQSRVVGRKSESSPSA